MPQLKLVFVAATELNPRIWVAPFREAIETFGQLTLVEHGNDMTPEEIGAVARGHDVVLTGWNSAPLPADLAADPGQCRYICHITGEMRRYVPVEIIESALPVTNWGNAPAGGVAEGAMCLLLALVKDLRRRVELVSTGGWKLDDTVYGGTLYNLNLGIYGLGFIGQRFLEMVQPFGAVLRGFDPYLEAWPDGIERVDSLRELFTASDAVVVHAGLTPETRHTVDAEMLALLPDNGVLINTARGGIIDQDALFAELRSGRLRAGLDVLEPDSLPADHEARAWPNLILTAHCLSLGGPQTGERVNLQRYHEVCLENLARFRDGQPLEFLMTPERYALST